MPFWILTATVIVVIAGFAYIAYRAGRGRRDSGPDVWIGGDVPSSDRDDGSAWIATADSGSDFAGEGGDFGGGGASGGWESDSGGGDRGGDGGGGDGGGGSD